MLKRKIKSKSMAERQQNIDSEESWDPMMEDYRDATFNSYNHNPELNVTMQKSGGSKLPGMLRVDGLPMDLSMNGLKSMFSEVGDVLLVSDLKHKSYSDDCYRFVTMSTVEAAKQVVEKFHGYTLSGGKYQFSVKIIQPTDSRQNQPQPILFRENFSTRQEAVQEDSIKQHPVSPSLIKRQADTLHCTVCNKPALKKCVNCKIPYCSKECQTNDWPKHKVVCCQQDGVAEKHHVPVSRCTSSSGDSEFEKRFEITIGEEVSSLVANLTGSKDDVSDGNVSSEKSVEMPSSQALGLQKRQNALLKVTGKPSSNRLKYDSFKKVTLEGDMNVKIMSFTDPSDFWVIPAASISLLQDLQSGLDEYYRNSTFNQNYTPTQGDICVAQFSIDSHWYRCCVDCVLQGTNEVGVSYVDYGNSEIIPLSSTRKLERRFAALPLQAVHCYLDGVKPIGAKWAQQAVFCASELMPEFGIVNIVVNTQNKENTAIDVYTTEGVSIAELLVAEGYAQYLKGDTDVKKTKTPSLVSEESILSMKDAAQQKEVKSETMVSQNEIPLQNAGMPYQETAAQIRVFEAPVVNTVLKSLKVNDVILFEVQVIVSPNEFWVHICNDEATTQLHKLSLQLNSQYSRLPPNIQFMPTVGTFCACQYSKDENWYRAQVVDVTDESISVFYLDFGNREVVPLTHVHKLLPKFCQLPFQALLCALAGVCGTEADGSWNTRARDFFVQNVSGRMRGKIVARDELLCKVVVTLPSGTTLNKKLVAEGLATWAGETSQVRQNALMEEDKQLDEEDSLASVTMRDLTVLDPRSLYDVIVVYAPHLNHIIVQVQAEPFLSDSKAVNEVMAKYQPLMFTHQPKVGDFVAAKYSADGKWYRAEIGMISPSSEFHVHFIDYGNEENVDRSSIARLPKNVLSYPAFGIRCSLAEVREENTWIPALLEEQNFEMVVKYKAEQVLYIELYNSVSGRAISDQLIELGYAVAKLPKEAKNVMQITDEVIYSPATRLSEFSNVTSSPDIASCIGSTENTKETMQHSPIMSSDIPYKVIHTEQITACCTYFLSSAEFYIICVEEESQSPLRCLTSKLQTLYNTGNSLEKDVYVPVTGELVAAFCDQKQCWYRAEVLKKKHTEFEVCYVDCGSVETISECKISQLKPELANLPKQSLHCQLREGLELSNEDELKVAILNKSLKYELHASKTKCGSYIISDIRESKHMISVISNLMQQGIIRTRTYNSTPEFTETGDSSSCCCEQLREENEKLKTQIEELQKLLKTQQKA